MHHRYKIILYAFVGIFIGLGLTALYRSYQVEKYDHGRCFYTKISCMKARCEPVKVCPGLSPTAVPTPKTSKK